jgi:hypothetical protein
MLEIGSFQASVAATSASTNTPAVISATAATRKNLSMPADDR